MPEDPAEPSPLRPRMLIELLTMVVVVDAVGRRPPDLLAASIAVGIWVGELTWILVVASNSEPASTP